MTVPFWVPSIIIRHLVVRGTKRDHNLDITIHVGVGLNKGSQNVRESYRDSYYSLESEP